MAWHRPGMDCRTQMPALAALLDLEPFPVHAKGVDVFLPYLERMRVEGAVVLLKLDGERTVGHAPPYTTMANRTGAGSPFFRGDHPVLEEALARIVIGYATEYWGFRADHGPGGVHFD